MTTPTDQPIVVDPRYAPRWSGRRPLPNTRSSLTHKMVINGLTGRFKGFLVVGLYDDGTPGELFVTVDQSAPDTRGALRDMATMISIALQWGAPIDTIIKHLLHHRYEPSGPTENPDIRIAKSISDYIGRWLATTFLPTQPTTNPTTGETTP